MGQLMNDFQERLYLIFTGIFIASLVACNLIFQKFFTWNFLGQTFDVWFFNYLKNLTQGNHLWLRNNASTMFSQLVDTSMVLLILCSAGAIGWERFGSLLLMGWLFKVIVALIDTPIIYFLLWVLKDKIRPASYLEEK